MVGWGRLLEEWGECVFLFQQKLIVGFESDLVENLPFSGGKLSEKVDHSGSEWKARRAEEVVGMERMTIGWVLRAPVVSRTGHSWHRPGFRLSVPSFRSA